MRVAMIGVIIALSSCDSRSAPTPPIPDGTAARSCPTHLDMELIGASSRFDPGWTGVTHGVGLSTGSQLTVEVTSCDAECRRCQYRGPIRGAAPVIGQRCLGDYARTCEQDSDCPGTGPCRFMFPPIASSIGVATCALTYFEPPPGPDPSPVRGVIDLVTGESDFAVFDLVVAVAIQPCRNCVGDPSPFDGVQGGTCTAGGQPCDVHGIGTSVASQTSFDCPPTVASALSIAMPGGGTTTSARAWTMDATRPMCTANGATTKRCWCGVCNDGAACMSNGDCATGTCGAASAMGIAITTNNHSCGAANTCIWDATTQSGRCSNQPTQKCFPDTGTIVARGDAEARGDHYIAQLANLLCMPAFGDGLLDAVGGFPGLLYFQARFRVTPRTVTP